MRKGYIQVYTGSGKGKTTAALGLALRAAGAGLRVFIAQFVKQRRCNEHKILERFQDLITIKHYGKGFITEGRPTKSAIKAAQDGLDEVLTVLKSGRYDVVILDEANVAVHYNLIPAKGLFELIAAKPGSTELIITGRYADRRVIQMADLVTEMREVKHYRKKGVRSRAGIEY